MLTASMKSLIPSVERICEKCKTVVWTPARLLKVCDKCRPAAKKERARKYRLKMAAKAHKV